VTAAGAHRAPREHGTDTIWIKSKSRFRVSRFPIFSYFIFSATPSRHFAPFVVKNALVDSDLSFPIFFFPDFIFFRHRPDLQLKLCSQTG